MTELQTIYGSRWSLWMITDQWPKIQFVNGAPERDIVMPDVCRQSGGRGGGDNCWITPPSAAAAAQSPAQTPDNLVLMWHIALSPQPRTTVQRAAYFAQFKVDIDKYSSLLSADMTRSRLLGCVWVCWLHDPPWPWAGGLFTVGLLSTVHCSTVQYSAVRWACQYCSAGLGCTGD